MKIKDTAEAWESGALGRDERYVEVVEMEYPTIGEEIERLKAENERLRARLAEVLSAGKRGTVMVHAPGPWYVGKSPYDQSRHVYAEQVVNADGYKRSPLIAVCPDGVVNHEANARLIAAAPELLEALDAALDLIGTLTSSDSGVLRYGRDVIESARGY